MTTAHVEYWEQEPRPQLSLAPNPHELEPTNIHPEPVEPDLDAEASAADSVRLYLDAINKIPLLTAEQEVDLAKRIEAGLYAQEKLTNDESILRKRKLRSELGVLVEDGQAAKQIFVESNLRWSFKLARKHCSTSDSRFFDVLQEANLGLIRAVEKFDYTKGYKFSTYATWWIRQSIQRGGMENDREIRLPVHMIERINKYKKTAESMAVELGYQPSDEQIAARLKTTVDAIRETRRSQHLQPISLNKLVGDGDLELGELLSDENIVDPSETAIDMTINKDVLRDIQQALSVLSEAERNAVVKLNGLDGTPPLSRLELKERLGGSVDTINRNYARGIAKLRHPSNPFSHMDESDRGQWRSAAECRERNIPVDNFFPLGRDKRTGPMYEVGKACGSCAVRQACLDYAIQNNEKVGVWGGLTANARQSVIDNQENNS